MHRWILAALAVVTVTACGDLGDRTHRVDRTSADFTKICLDGVSYWFRSKFERSYMAPVWRIDDRGQPQLEACTADSHDEHNSRAARPW